MKKNKIVISLMFCLLLAASVLAGHSEAQAAGGYTLQINKGTNVVTVYNSAGAAERAFVCSTGTATPLGTYNTKQKLRWHVLDGPSYGQYCTRITGSILFHSVWYYRNGDYASQSYREYNKLGTTASHGCVRLTVADAKWIYDNCPLGTTVNIIYGSSANDPLGKPAAIKVPNTKEGWDPTDPMPGNPYNTARPSIDTSGANRTISYGTTFNPYAGIVARDSLGNDISGWLRHDGNVNTKKLGKYKVTYGITDALGREAYASVTYQVKDTEKATIKGVKKNLTKEYNSTINLKKNVKAYNVTGKNLTKKIQIKVIYPGSKKEKTYKKDKLKLSKLGTYKINYYVKNPNNKLTTKLTCKVKVQDTKAPKFTGVKSKKTVEYNSKQNLKSGIKAKLVSGKNMTSKITVKVKAPKDKKYKKLSESKIKKYKFSKLGTYKVEYSVANPNNKKAVAKKVTSFTVKDTKKPKLSGKFNQRTLEYNQVLNLRSGVSAKLVSGANMTSKIVTKVKVPGTNTFATVNEAASKKYKFNKTGTYTVEYSVANPNNKKNVAKATMKVVVNDTKAPVISGVANKEIEIEGKLNLKAGVKAVLLSGVDVTGNLKIAVTTPDGITTTFTGEEYTFDKAGTYKIVYTVANPQNGGAVAQAEMSVLVKDNRKLVIEISNQKIKDIKVGEDYAVYDGVTASLGQSSVPANAIKAVITGKNESGQNIANIPAVSADGKVKFTEAGTYTITYTVEYMGRSAAAELILNVSAAAPTSDSGSSAQSQAPEAKERKDSDVSENGNEPEAEEPQVNPQEEPETEEPQVNPQEEPEAEEPQKSPQDEAEVNDEEFQTNPQDEAEVNNEELQTNP